MVVLYIILGVIAALLAVLLINTFQVSGKARKLSGSKPAATEEALAKYAEGMARMLRCKTVSVKDSYDDTEFAKLRQVVKEQFPLLHEKAERMNFAADCWFYKIPGKDTGRNILLMSHHDVVAAEEEWKCDPFGGEVIDGAIYGRGAADTKGSLFAILCAAEDMLAEGFVPEVNVWVGSSHNEELGGDGIPTALRYFQEQGITFEVILDEGGAIVEPPLAGMKCEMCAMVAVHEKGRLKLKCTAKTQSSHVSLTGYKGNPVERVAAFIQEVTTSKAFIRRLNPQVRAMLQNLAPYCGFPMKVVLCNLWLFGGLLAKIMPKLNATAGGMVGTTLNFQEISGSTTGKVCTTSVMLRNINEEDLKADYAVFKAVADKHGIALEEERNEYYAPADMESKAYRYTMDCLAKIFPCYPAAPYILPAGTDAWRLTPVCDCVLRFAPTRMNKQQLGSIHAVDENIDVSALYEAAVFYKYFAENYQ